MTEADPFRSPSSDDVAPSADGSICPCCGIGRLVAGSIRSGMSIDWLPGPAPRGFRWRLPSLRLSRAGLSSCASVRGQRCGHCGRIVLEPD